MKQAKRRKSSVPTHFVALVGDNPLNPRVACSSLVQSENIPNEDELTPLFYENRDEGNKSRNFQSILVLAVLVILTLGLVLMSGRSEKRK